MSRKLKRERMQQTPGNQESLGLPGERKIQSRRPTPEDPCLRRYAVDSSMDTAGSFQAKGIIDARDQERQPGEYRLEDIQNRIICGDAGTVLAKIPGDCIRCIITSPPYWNTIDYGVAGQYGTCSYDEYLEQLLTVWRECSRILKPNGKLCINAPIIPISKSVVNSQHTRHYKNLNNDIERTILQNIPGLHRYGLYVWQKQTTEKMFGSYPYPPNIYEQNTIEFINVFVKPGAPEQLPRVVKEASRLSEKAWLNLTKQVWELYPEDVKRSSHPAPFPRALPNRLVAMYTFRRVETDDMRYPGDVVLDPFCGVGATCIAAKELERNYIGVDLVPDFCIEAASRLEVWPSRGEVFLVDKPGNRPGAAGTETLL